MDAEANLIVERANIMANIQSMQQSTDRGPNYKYLTEHLTRVDNAMDQLSAGQGAMRGISLLSMLWSAMRSSYLLVVMVLLFWFCWG